MIKFSVTIPAYKGKYLSEAIESVLSQTYSNYELIIVDDHSPENLKSIVEQFSDPRIRYYRNDKNCGAINVVDNWNICLGYCTGDYVICMGDDDILLPCCLEEYTKQIEKYPAANVYHAWTQIIDERGNIKEVLEPRPDIETFFSLTYYRWKGRRQFIGDFCYSVEHLRFNNGYYRIPLAWGTDDITAARASLNGGIVNTTRPCFAYRESSVTISNSTDHTIIKLESSIVEKNWYNGLLSTIDENKLNRSDLWFFSKIKEMLDFCFVRKMTSEILKDIHSNIFNLFFWVRKCTEFGICRRYLIKRYVKDLMVR